MPAASFLDIVKKHHGDEYAGDQFGGAAGTDGSGLPTGNSGNFMFATGIECSYPTIENVSAPGSVSGAEKIARRSLKELMMMTNTGNSEISV